MPGGAERFFESIFGAFINLDKFIVLDFNKRTDIMFFGQHKCINSYHSTFMIMTKGILNHDLIRSGLLWGLMLRKLPLLLFSL